MNLVKSIKSNDYKELTSIFNADNAKLVALSIAVLLVAYSFFSYDSDRCELILELGHPVTSSNLWQPYGCMMQTYTSKEAKNCMSNVAQSGLQNRLAFVGDSRIRQIFEEVLSLFQPVKNKTWNKHSDLRYTNEKLALDLSFRWQPMVDEAMYADFKSWIDDRPSLVVVGSGTWAVKESNGNSAARANFRANLSTIIPLIEKLHDTTTVVWMMQDDVVEKLLSANRSMITNEQISLYNSAVSELFRYSTVSIWSSNRLISQAYPSVDGDGLHISDSAVRLDGQLLMNYYCNRHLNHTDAACCRRPESVTFLQATVELMYILAIAVSVIAAILWFVQKRSSNAHHTLPSEPSEEEQMPGHQLSQKPLVNAAAPSKKQQPQPSGWFLVTFARFGIVMAYMFICDRTEFFMQENKQRGLANFFLPLLYTFSLGLFFNSKLEDKQAGFLNRFQTEEWKGWMQLMILIYHFTGASQIVPVYAVIRAVVSAYIFLNGFAHTTYFLNGGSFGLNRLCKQLFRLNFLVFMMCVTMNRPYMFYYFVPLITFWFLTVFVVFAIPPRPVLRVQEIPTSNNDGQVLVSSAIRGPIFNTLIRLFLLFCFINVLYHFETLFRLIFTWPPIKFLFVTSDDSLHEWRFRWELDRYSALAGCTFGFVMALLKHRSLLPDSLAASRRPWSLIFAIGSIIVVISYGLWTSFCTNKVTCNQVHPWIVGPVILSYVLLRNQSCLRIRYSTFFAWFGHISLELFLAQYHIWLASDSRGILVLIPNYQVLNIVITTFLFVCASHELQTGTGKLADFLIPDTTQHLIRNCAIFLFSLIIAANFRLLMPHGM